MTAIDDPKRRVTLDDFNDIPLAASATREDAWLENAADLLREPDPGPTPFLVGELIVDLAIATIVGPWKVAKSYSLLEFAVAIVTGRAAFGMYEVPMPGPVILVMEESGRAAFHRRLDRLSRGYALRPEALTDLHFAANLGVRLNEYHWQARLLEAGRSIRPRAIMLDPLVRLKGATVDESSQREMGPVLDFMRLLRDESDSAVVYSHHTGHQGSHQRGSSDLEGYWESRLAIKKDTDGVRTITAEHREAESGHEFRFVLDFDEETRTLRLRALEDPLVRKVEEHLREHPADSANDVWKQLGGRRQDVLKVVSDVRKRLDLLVPEPGNHPGTTPSGSYSASGSREGLFRPPGTTPADLLAGLVPEAGNHPPHSQFVHCPKHDTTTTVEKVDCGVTYLACGCSESARPRP